MEYVVVGVLIYLLYLAGNWMKEKVMNNPAIGEIMDGMDDLHE